MTKTLLALLALSVSFVGCSAADTTPARSPAATGLTTPDAAGAGSPAPELDRFYGQSISWAECRDGFECATVQVPLDYDEPDGATIELALLRAPAADADRRVGSLVVNPGGPGASGTDYAAAADLVVSPAVRDRYDVVGVDPRGVGASTPVDCVDDAQLDESFSASDPSPDTPAEVDELLAGSAEFRAGCEQRSGDLLPHVGTQDVARDLDVLRAVLGDERLTFLGKSYGTSIGTEYARQFPERVGRLVLDGAIDPALDEKAVLLGQAEGFELALSRFVADCLASGCALGSSATEVLDAVDEVLTSTDSEPLPTSARPLTQSLATYGIVGPLYWPPEQGYPLLESALDQALDGDGSGLLQLADLYLQRNPDGTYDGNQWDVFTPVSCLDRPGGQAPQDIEAALPEFEAVSPVLGESLAWGLLSCTDWPVDSDGLPAPVAAAGAPPILVVGTTGDPATPYRWSVALAEQLDSGVLLTYESTPHTAYRKGSGCVDGAVDAYLLEGTVPEDGARCS